MGCTASKLDNEDTVRRCKERRRLMKDAVYARHHLAAAHADYCRSLRLTGSALSTFAAGEQLSVSDQTPAVFLHPPNPSSTIPTKPSPSPSLYEPPLPPLFSSSASPSPSPAPSKPPQPPPPSLPRIVHAPPKRRRKPLKLPHILSESSPSSSPRSEFSNNFFPTAYQANSTYSTTPSQASSVWNWENFYPPSPPDSEFFNRRAQETQIRNNQNHHHLDTDPEYEPEPEPETERSEYDFFQPQQHHQRNNTSNRYNHYNPDPKLNPFRKNHNVDDETEEREEVQCSEWGDHYSSSTSSEEEEDEELDKDSRSEMESIGTRSDFRSNSVKQQPPVQQPVYTNNMKKSEDAASSSSFRTTEISDMKMVVRHKDLKEIVDALKENFDKGAAAGDQLSDILEIGRAQLDRSFRQLKSNVVLISI